MSRRASTRAAIIVASVSVVAACGADPASPPSDDGVRASMAGLYVGTAVLANAEQLLIADCMEQHGYVFKPVLSIEDRQLPQPYGDDVTAARSSGFVGLQRAVVGSGLEPDLAGLTPGQVDQRRRALDDGAMIFVDAFGSNTGIASGGCRGLARSQVYGSTEDWLMSTELLNNALGAAMYPAVDDPSVQEALETWADCMQSRGYERPATRDEPRAQAADFANDYDATTAKAKEIALAVDDAECDAETGYAVTRRSAEDALLTAFARNNEDVITGIQENLKASVLRAQKVLEG